MKRIVLAIIILLCASGLTHAQERHRLDSGQPYDVFVSVRGHYLMPQSNLLNNYDWGAGGDIQLEIQYQELKLSWGIGLGYDRFQPKMLKWDYLPTKQLFVAQQVPLVLFSNYYIFNERIKPYVGLGLGLLWGRYDYSFSSYENTHEYYSRDYEGQTGFRLGLLPRVGLMISTNHKHGFGVEFGMQHYFEMGRLEKQTTLSAALQYTYIFD